LKLERARSWMKERPHKIEKDLRDFIEDSIKRADAEKNAEAARIHREKQAIAQIRKVQRRMWAAMVAVATLTGIGIAALIWLGFSVNERESRLFASKARDAFELGYCDRAIRLAIAGLPLRALFSFSVWSQEAEDELRKAANDCRLLRVLSLHNEDLHSVALSADNTRIVTSSADGTAIVWSLVEGKEPVTLRSHGGEVVQAEFDRSGRYVVTASRDSTARIFDAETGELVQTLSGHTGGVVSAQFDRTGRRVLTASVDG